MIQQRRRQRIATMLLTLFVSLLAMVTLHEVSHTSDRVQQTALSHVLHDGLPHVDQPECSLCQLIHPPFLSLTTLPTLVAVLLVVTLLLERELGHRLRFTRLCQQLRAPPVY